MSLLRSPCKINVGLFVLGRRPDGFHELDTLFARLAFSDRITVTPAPRLTVVAEPWGPQNEENLVYRALREVERRWGTPLSLRVHIEKRVPMGAGLGGGSANAAVVLRWLVRTHGVPKDLAREVARRIGADVAFFFEEVTWARGRGRGDQLEPLVGLPERVPVLLVLPPFGVSTAQAYQALAKSGAYTPAEEAQERMERLVAALRRRLWAEASQHLANDFEPLVFRWHPELRELKVHLRRMGAMLAGLSGTGSALFGVFPQGRPAELSLPPGFRGVWTQIGAPEHHEGS